MSVLADPVDLSLSLKVKGAAALRVNEPPSPDGDFRCGICHKSYSRRDLRDRHRRRCIKTAGQERTSKRKSCETCAQKKVRCSMTRPACGRCLQTRTPCHYPPTSVPANAAAVAAKNSNDNNNHDRSIPKAPSSCASSGSPSTPLSPRDGSRRDSMAGLNLSPDVSSAATSLADTQASLPTLSEVAFPHLQQCQSSECHSQEALDPLLAPWSPMPTSININIHQILRPPGDSTLFAPHELCAVDLLPRIDDLSPLSEHFSPDATLDAAWLPPPLMSLHELSKSPLTSPTLPMMDDPLRLAGGMAVSSEPDGLWRDRLPKSVEDVSPQPQLSEQLTFGHDFLPPSGKLSSREANDAAPAAADG